MGTAVLAAVGLLDATAEGVCDELCTVADAQYGETTDEPREVYLERLGVVDAVGRTAEDNADDVAVVLRILVVRQDLTKGIELADTTANELCRLGTEV